MTYKTSRFLAIGTITKFFRPDVILLKDKKIEVDKKSWLFLVSSNDSIEYKNIASVRVKTSFFQGKLTIETQGGAKEDFVITKLWSKTAKKIKEEIMKRCEEG